MTGAVTASLACRPGRIQWSASDATYWPSWTTSISTRCTGADCRWAAWSDSGSAPMRRRGSARSFSPNPPAPIPPCHYPDPTNWLNRINAVKQGGMAAVAETIISGWLTADFREREPQITANMKAMLLAAPVQGYLACCEALSALDQRELLPKIKSPTLVIAGRHDMATPIAAGEYIPSHIPGAALPILDAAHISNVEQPHAFSDAVIGFLTQR